MIAARFATKLGGRESNVVILFKDRLFARLFLMRLLIWGSESGLLRRFKSSVWFGRSRDSSSSLLMMLLLLLFSVESSLLDTLLDMLSHSLEAL